MSVCDETVKETKIVAVELDTIMTIPLQVLLALDNCIKRSPYMTNDEIIKLLMGAHMLMQSPSHEPPSNILTLGDAHSLASLVLGVCSGGYTCIDKDPWGNTVAMVRKFASIQQGNQPIVECTEMAQVTVADAR